MTPSYRKIFNDGLWHKNTGLVALLGLCPLLAVSTTIINSLALGLATILTLSLSNLTVSMVRTLLRPEIRIPAYVLIIASIVTAVELSMQAWFHDLYLSLGIFIPLIVTNCAIIGRAESFASRHPPLPALVDGFATGAGFCLALFALGATRELMGHGSLLRDAQFLLGEGAATLQLTIIPHYDGFRLAILPAGAFIFLGFLIALRSWLAR